MHNYIAVLVSHVSRAVPEFGSESGSGRNPVIFPNQPKSGSGKILAGFQISTGFVK